MLLRDGPEDLVHDSKAALRRSVRQMRAGLSTEALDHAGRAIAARILAMPEIGRAKRVLCYLSVRREVPTAGLLAGLAERGIEIAVPRVIGDGVMEARRLQLPLVPAVLGIPTSDGAVVDTVDVCLCPGLAFDRSGGRLGYGGGFYDAWLTRVRPLAIGICVEEALIDELPMGPHDRRMDVVVTPSERIDTGWGAARIRVVAGVWIREGRVLATRRGPTQAQAGLWELPGGKVEPGEADDAALVRELREELQVTVAVLGGALATAEHAYGGLVVELVAYPVHGIDDPVLTEHDALRWLSVHELHDVTWAPADVPLLDAVAAQLAG